MQVAVVFLIGLFLTFCSEPRTVLEEVRAEGTLRVAIREDLTSYYRGTDGPVGFEYDLARGFAADLGVALEIVPATAPATVLANLRRDRVQLAAGLVRSGPPPADVRFGPGHRGVETYVIYRRGARRPRSPAALAGKRVAVLADSRHRALLARLRRAHPRVRWIEVTRFHADDLLEEVALGRVEFAVADSDEFLIKRWLYPEIEVGFKLPEPGSRAWAFSRQTDDSLFRAALLYLHRAAGRGELERLREQYYDHLRRFDYVAARRRLENIARRLPRLRKDFERAGQRHRLDWRLLAAVGYHESRWDPKARSSTGVRGIMMLTRATAAQLGIADREDAAASIEGGATYFARLAARLPASVAEPDRTWLALAAYNVGFGHLQDARILARRAGADPNDWITLKRFLPRLTKARWYKQTRHGYARGYAPIRYVESVRRTYDVLLWRQRYGHAERS